jgi:hypothetical protein
MVARLRRDGFVDAAFHPTRRLRCEPDTGG